MFPISSIVGKYRAQIDVAAMCRSMYSRTCRRKRVDLLRLLREGFDRAHPGDVFLNRGGKLGHRLPQGGKCGVYRHVKPCRYISPKTASSPARSASELPVEVEHDGKA